MDLEPPQFGLNFINEDKKLNRDFMLMCGFEKFDNYYVRIDILERLFLMIIDINKNNNDKEIKISSRYVKLAWL